MTHLDTRTSAMPVLASTAPPAPSTGASAAPGREVFMVAVARVRSGRAAAAHGHGR